MMKIQEMITKIWLFVKTINIMLFYTNVKGLTMLAVMQVGENANIVKNMIIPAICIYIQKETLFTTINVGAEAGDRRKGKLFCPMPKLTTYHNADYLKYIRTKPSLYSGRCGTPDDPIVASHQGFGKGGTALKAPDTHAVPLLHTEHQIEHQVGEKTFWGDMYDALPLRCLEYVSEYLQTLKKK